MARKTWVLYPSISYWCSVFALLLLSYTTPASQINWCLKPSPQCSSLKCPLLWRGKPSSSGGVEWCKRKAQTQEADGYHFLAVMPWASPVASVRWGRLTWACPAAVGRGGGWKIMRRTLYRDGGRETKQARMLLEILRNSWKARKQRLHLGSGKSRGNDRLKQGQ